MTINNLHLLKAEISASAVKNNLQVIRKLLHPDTKLCSAVKADAYGHRINLLLDIISELSDMLAVSTPYEALELRSLGYQGPILLFQTIFGFADGTEREDALAELKFFLRQTRRIDPGEPDTFMVMSLKSAIKSFNEIASVAMMVTLGIVSISLLVGGVGIMNIMLVSVTERTREIGLRKAVGARQSAVLTQFLIESVVLCSIGGLIGIGFGQLLTAAFATIPNMNLDMAYIPWWAIALAFVFSTAVGLFFGMFPAIKAARLDPIEALRNE